MLDNETDVIKENAFINCLITYHWDLLSNLNNCRGLRYCDKRCYGQLKNAANSKWLNRTREFPINYSKVACILNLKLYTAF